MIFFKCLNEEELKRVARIVAEEIDQVKSLLLIGDLGTGKTTFVKGFVTCFDLEESSVKSPTFSILNIYKGSRIIYHLDLYRIEHPDEELLMEIEEALEQNGTILAVEWADRLKDFWPENFLKIHFEFCDNGRKITIESDNKAILERIALRWSGGQEIRKT